MIRARARAQHTGFIDLVLLDLIFFGAPLISHLVDGEGTNARNMYQANVVCQSNMLKEGPEDVSQKLD